ncbi:MAG: helix-turn-helix domain-containing protein [Bacillota bacterium]
MALGERIQELRKRRNLSQEALADKLNISRQVVSKWETGLSNPDTKNLLLLAELFEISVDDLIGAKPEETSTVCQEPKKRARRTSRIIAALISIIIAGTSIWLGVRRLSSTVSSGNETPGEYTLCWVEDGSSRQHLEIGIRDGSFPWNTTLTGSDTSHTSGDMPGVEFHTVDCKNIVISYARNMETGKETLTSMTTVSPNHATARGIKAGDTEIQLIAAYGDDLLIMPESYSSKDDFCMYNSLYAFSGWNDGYHFVVFYMLNGQIRGIKVQMAEDGGPAYYVDNINTFRLLNGKPDYSEKHDPEQDILSKERKVYVALHTLLNYSLTEEDAFPHRNTIFTGLQCIDWPAYGRLGEAGKEAETIQELFNWIKMQESLANDEIAGLQLALLSNLDGIYTDMYSHVLCNAFFEEPAVFIECLNYDPDNSKNSKNVVMLTVYGAADRAEDLERVQAVLHKLLDFNVLSDGAVPWAEEMLKRCDDPYGTNQ